jgi:hypothetical protein
MSKGKNKIEELKKKEEELSEVDNFNELPPTDAFAFLETRSGADLLRLYKENDLDMSPDFQRDDVWPNTTKTKFIDSLTKDLPIPSMCFSYEINTGKYIVVDGRQRINAIISLLKDNSDWKKFSHLKDVREELSGKSVEDVKKNNANLIQKVKNVTLPITVVRYDSGKKNHMEYIFTIFHRLNTGGMKLNNQEIRNCIFQGSFNKFLKTLSAEEESKNIFGENRRFNVEEQILRFFCFDERWSKYSGSFSNFLNDYMETKRDIGKKEMDTKKNLFNDVMKIAILIPSFKNESKAVKDAVMVAISKNIKNIKKIDGNDRKKIISNSFNKLKTKEIFSMENLMSSLDNKSKTLKRFKVAINIFKS